MRLVDNKTLASKASVDALVFCFLEPELPASGEQVILFSTGRLPRYPNNKIIKIICPSLLARFLPRASHIRFISASGRLEFGVSRRSECQTCKQKFQAS